MPQRTVEQAGWREISEKISGHGPQSKRDRWFTSTGMMENYPHVMRSRTIMVGTTDSGHQCINPLVGSEARTHSRSQI